MVTDVSTEMVSGPPPTIVSLRGAVQNYAWGSTTLIPSLLGVEPDGLPQAELWLGAHPVLPSFIDGVSLLASIAAEPMRFLGARSADVEYRLPFLMKVMAVASPLSIQVHPSKEQAHAGFERENGLGIAVDAGNRNYRDPNHKPEIICALREFSLLSGFVSDAEVNERLRAIAAASSGPARQALEAIGRLAPQSAGTDIEARRKLLGAALEIPMEVCEGVVDAVRSVARARQLDYLVRIADHYPRDAGVLVAALMNHRVLQPGEAMFFAAGNAHAYLEGLGIEVLANSDNVVRAGLTPKHIDVHELLELCDVSPSSGLPVAAEITDRAGEAGKPGERMRWIVNCPDFALQQVSPGPGSVVSVGTDAGPRIALCTTGSIHLSDAATGASRELRAGQSAWLFPGVDLVVRSDTPNSAVFLAESPALSGPN
jgi:mannose-6-phosphate isomerase